MIASLTWKMWSFYPNVKGNLHTSAGMTGNLAFSCMGGVIVAEYFTSRSLSRLPPLFILTTHQGNNGTVVWVKERYVRDRKKDGDGEVDAFL